MSEASLVDVDDDRNRGGFSRVGGQEGVVNSMMKEISKAGFRNIERKKKNREGHAVEKDGSIIFPISEGYTLAPQRNLEEIKSETKKSDEAQKIEQVLTLWPQGNKTDALKILRGVNWKEPMNFGEKPYLFSINEQIFKSMKSEDQKRIGEENMKDFATVKEIASEVVRLGQNAASSKDYTKAERYLESGLQLGKLLNRDANRIIVRLVGMSAEKKI